MSPVDLDRAKADMQDGRFIAVVRLIGATGAKEFQIRFQDEEEPVTWTALARWGDDWEAAGAMMPLGAALRLAERVVDGGTCAHCGKPTGLMDDFTSPLAADKLICWYVYDPETKRFRRSCEGETTGRMFGFDRKTGRAVGRNDECPCGSGRKFKLCHGA